MSQSSSTDIDASQVATGRQAMLDEVRQGLRLSPKEISSKYLYDEEGSHLFERICELDAYYPTRTELGIMEQHIGAMAEAIGPEALIVELGSGASLKTEILLESLDRPVGCVLIDISREHLKDSAERLGARFPHIEILPLEADYTGPVDLPTPSRPPRHNVMYFPGSTLGNFDRGPAHDFLRRLARGVGVGGGMLLGLDLIKDREVLELAYDDPEGVTAAFNLNVLTHINRELGADFDVERFRHVALWNEEASRIEMHLESVGEQTVHIEGEAFQFTDGERICTEHSNKFGIEEFAEIARETGWRVDHVWTDERPWFSVQYLECVSV